eukprot:scaffold233081_cov28-Tisochrysis_lutea.AAC.2
MRPLVSVDAWDEPERRWSGAHRCAQRLVPKAFPRRRCDDTQPIGQSGHHFLFRGLHRRSLVHKWSAKEICHPTTLSAKHCLCGAGIPKRGL